MTSRSSIMSGRCLDDVQRRTGIDGLIYAGNHGLEISGQGLSFEHPTAFELREEMRGLRRGRCGKRRRFRAWRSSRRDLTASVHFRRASPHIASSSLDFSARWSLTMIDDSKSSTGRRSTRSPACRLGQGPRGDLRPRPASPTAEGCRSWSATTRPTRTCSLRFDDGITIRVDPHGPTSARYSSGEPDRRA